MMDPRYFRWILSVLPAILLVDIFLTVFRGVDFLRYVSCAGETSPCIPGMALIGVFFWFGMAGFTFWIWRVWRKRNIHIKLWKGILVSLYAYLLFQIAFLLFLDNVAYIFGIEPLTKPIGQTGGIAISVISLLISLITIFAIYTEQHKPQP